jgi:hypothetical protein
MLNNAVEWYETVAASQSAQVLGETGATNDFLSHLLVTPANLNPGPIDLIDGATTMRVFTGGTGSIADLKPFVIPLTMRSKTGSWKLTTGADVLVFAVGRFV